MNIISQRCCYNNLGFKGANLNINALSDSHGNLKQLDTFYENMRQNKDEIFLENKRGNQNALVVSGDWFISGATNGYKSNKKANSHDFQIQFFNEFASKVKSLGRNTKTYLIPGNHEFDAGAEEFARVAKKISAKILMTNLDFENSPALQEEIQTGKIVQKDILEIKDDKDKKKTHKVLFVGINPVNMPYYNKNLSGINFINQPYKAQKAVTPEDYKESFDETVKIIDEFKENNPKGLVVVSSHTGVDFAKNLAQKLGDKVNIIFDGHEHKDEIEEVNGVKIVKLSQNFKKYVNAKFALDDDGNLKNDVQITSHYPNKEKHDTKGFFDGFFRGIFNQDLMKEFKIKPLKKDVKSLDIEGVRYQNSYLANFVTDSILTQIQKTNPEVQIFALSASAIRSPLETQDLGGADNISVIETLSGIVQQDADIFENKLTGEEVLNLVLDNVLFNEKAPERNPLIQYSGLVIDRKALIEGYRAGQEAEDLLIHVRTPEGEPLRADETYNVANVEKFYKKSKNPYIHTTLYESATPLNLNAKDLFIDYMEENKENLTAKCDVRVID